MLYNVQDKPPKKVVVSSVIQQLLANIAATITVPIIIGLNDFISAAILGCGVGTLIYLLITKRKSPVLLSSNFAFVGALILAYTNCGILGIILGGLFSGSIYILLSFIVHKAGTKWIDKVFPPVVIGPIVMLIGLTLSSTAIADLVKVDNYSYVNNIGETIYPYNQLGLLCGLLTFFIVVICATQKRRPFISTIPFLFGVAGGYLIALIFTIIGNVFHFRYLQIIDFSPLINNFSNISFKSFISIPNFALSESIKEIANSSVKLTGIGVLEIAIGFIPISLVGFTEHIADHTNLSNIIEKDLIQDEPGLSRTLLGDGLGSIGGTLFGICPNTTYGEAVACVAFSKDASTKSILITSISCIALSFFTPLIAFFRSIPSCVVGGICLALFGYIAISGLRMLKKVDLDDNRNILTASVILVTGLGSLSLLIPYRFGYIDEASSLYGIVKWIEITPIAFSLIVGVITYYLPSLFNKEKSQPKS